MTDEEKVIEIIASALSDNDVRPRGKEIMALIEQARQAGIRQVVEWIREHTNMPIESDFIIFTDRNVEGELVIGNHIEVRQWQDQCKSWGIEENR